MPEYYQDPLGIIHVRDSSGPGEFTFCGREIALEAPGIMTEYCDDGTFQGTPVKGPANCKNCLKQIQDLKNAMAGIKWSKNMKTDNWEHPS